MFILLQEDTVEYYTNADLLYQDIIDNELKGYRVLKRINKTDLYRDVTDEITPRAEYMDMTQQNDQRLYEAAQCLPGVV